jgi:ribose transport system permease protein
VSEGGAWRRVRRLLGAAGPVLALALIVLGFAAASQVKNALDEHRFLAERAESRREAGLPAGPVPGAWEMVRERPNRLLTADALRATANQTVAVGVAAMGMTLVIISGGIDLSVGSVIALSSVVTAFALRAGWWPVWAAAAGVLTGGACGLANALAITRLRVVPFIATLGMWGMARGIAKGVAAEQKIDAPATWLGTDVLLRRPEPAWLLVSPGVWTMLLLAAAVAALLRYTVFGRYVFTIGSSEATARLCGIRVERVKLQIYAVAGLCTGLAGVLQFCRLTVGDPTTAVGTELDVIAAVVIGGGSLSGGEGSAFGSLLGAFIMAVLRVGCDHVGVPSWIQEIVIGAVIVLAVAADVWRHRSARRADAG